ncbi:MAG: hypothetical protein HOC71_16795, partial [Candidatus Latescibacteria bacterium]|nr:hypothetical protein [Candidatus Latescibacterota bacterium]
MKRREFIKKTATTTSLIAGTNLPGILPPAVSEAALGAGNESAPIVGIAGSNDPELTNPSPLDTLLSTEQVREVVWLALDRDTSPRSLTRIVGENSWVVIKPNLVTCP